MQDQTNETIGFTGSMIANLCQTHHIVRYAIPKRYELLLPRFRLETAAKAHLPTTREVSRWVVECWWRSSSDGTLGYYVKLDLLTKGVREFRELPGDITVPGMTITAAEMSYLDQCKTPWKIEPDSAEKAALLDELWQSLVPTQLKEYALLEHTEPTIETYLLPVESLTCWNWETLRDLLLKRENTTVAEMQDYIEYKYSGSNKRYIAPKHRAEAKAQGLRFWRDEDDI